SRSSTAEELPSSVAWAAPVPRKCNVQDVAIESVLLQRTGVTPHQGAPQLPVENVFAVTARAQLQQRAAQAAQVGLLPGTLGSAHPAAVEVDQVQPVRADQD